jgi:hypothetical protein
MDNRILYYFDIVVLLFRDDQTRKISKKVPSIYEATYREVAYGMVRELLNDGWRVYSISIQNIDISNTMSNLKSKALAS